MRFTLAHKTARLRRCTAVEQSRTFRRFSEWENVLTALSGVADVMLTADAHALVLGHQRRLSTYKSHNRGST